MNSTLEISAKRLRANFFAVQRVAGPNAHVLAVIKADGYGHGAALCAPVLRDAGANWLGVTDVTEGLAVRGALGEDLHQSFTRILVMCGSLGEDAPAIVANELTPVVWTLAHIDALEAAAEAAGRRVCVHLEIDTGMSRQGATMAELPAVLARLAHSRWLLCEGIMGHLCCAELTAAKTTRAAEGVLSDALSQAFEAKLQPEFIHLENTSAVDEGTVAAWFANAAARNAGPTTTHRMVRTGLALYGYTLPVEGQPHLHDKLQPVMTWTAPVTGLRDISVNMTVGYGATFTASRAMRLALLPVGYADGFRREASSGIGDGWVILGGKRAPVVGRVSMNLTVVDVTGIADVHIGDSAVLLGEGLTAEDHARWAGTIAYDILCGVRGIRCLAD